MTLMIVASSASAVNWPLTWAAVTAIATCALFISIPVSVWALVSAQRSDRADRRESEARRWDAYLSAACIRFLQSQSALMRMAQRAQLSGEKIKTLNAATENFEARFMELELIAPNQLVKSAQMLWAQTVGSISEVGFSDRWPRRYADDQRQAFLEQVREHFGLAHLYESSAEVLRRVNERNKGSGGSRSARNPESGIDAPAKPTG